MALVSPFFLTLENAVYTDRTNGTVGLIGECTRYYPLKPSETSPPKQRRRRIACAFYYGGSVESPPIAGTRHL